MERNDCHSPGRLIPSDYKFICGYSLPRGADYDGWGLEELALAQNNYTSFNPMGLETELVERCSSCGTRFKDGGVFLHLPSNEIVYFGHICANKYSVLADWSALEAEKARYAKVRATVLAKARNSKKAQAFMDTIPGLETALKTDHRIVKDMGEKLRKYHSLSEKQVAFVFKLYQESIAPKVEEKLVPAPIVAGRQTFTGKVVSCKSMDSQFGTSYKMTVKMTTPEGSWLVWGTIPAALMEFYGLGTLKGREVTVTATLKAGRDAHFAVMSRPVSSYVDDKPAEVSLGGGAV